MINSENPVRDVVLPKGKPAGETHAYSLEEITQMLQLLPEPASTIVAVAAFTGARKGELRGFLWENYDGEQVLISHSRKIDIVGFDSCLMATLETAYAMKDVARFMVASEEVVPDCSWDYASTLAALISAKGHLGAEGLSKLFVEGYEAKYTKYPSESVQNPTLAAVNLEGIHLAADSASTLAHELEGMLGSQSKNAVVSARNKSHFYGSLHNLIDLVNFLKILQNESQVPAAVASRARELESTITTAIYQYAHDPETSNGLSIYFPQNRRRYEDDGLDKEAYDTSRCSNPDRNHAVDFVCDTFWPIFIRTYLNSVGEASDEHEARIVQRDQRPK